MIGADAVRCMRRGTGGDSVNAATWWSINILASDDDHDIYRASVGNVEFRETVGGPTTAVGGTPFSEPATSTADRAFNGIPSLYWTAGGFDQLPIRLGYHHSTAVILVEISIQAGTDSVQASRTPTAFTVDYSDDGINWTTVLSVAGEPSWSPSEIRTYTL